MTGERASVVELFDDYERMELARLCPRSTVERCEDAVMAMFSGIPIAPKYKSDAFKKLAESLEKYGLVIPEPKPFPPTTYDGE